MKIACPHCSQHLELTPDVLAALQGQPHFVCPVCQGLMTVPEAPPPSSRPPPRQSQPSAKTHAGEMQAHRGLSRNMLVLGIATLLLLGGIGLFLASRNGGNIFNVFNNITNQIIHNSYFTQLIASGATTEKDLQAIAEIRPYGAGFIGISKELINWEQAQDLAKRTGAEVLVVPAGNADAAKLLKWLAANLKSHVTSPVWVESQGEVGMLVGAEVLVIKSASGQRRAFLHWQSNAIDTQTDPAIASKEKPFVNSLGMKFTPVPGTNVLFCIHEVRFKDYAAYAADSTEVNQECQNQLLDVFMPMQLRAERPVIYVNWNDAQSFCKWLNKKEGRTYRLPTDREWSFAIGIGEKEASGQGVTPATLSGKLNEFPWGQEWPPPSEAGNYILNPSDGYPGIAPVMSFKANEFGLHDLGGNVWEWVEDWYDQSHTQRVLRGGAWSRGERVNLLSSQRTSRIPESRDDYSYGFRIVLEVAGTRSP